MAAELFYVSQMPNFIPSKNLVLPVIARYHIPGWSSKIEPIYLKNKFEDRKLIIQFEFHFSHEYSRFAGNIQGYFDTIRDHSSGNLQDAKSNWFDIDFELNGVPDFDSKMRKRIKDLGEKGWIFLNNADKVTIFTIDIEISLPLHLEYMRKIEKYISYGIEIDSSIPFGSGVINRIEKFLLREPPRESEYDIFIRILQEEKNNRIAAVNIEHDKKIKEIEILFSLAIEKYNHNQEEKIRDEIKKLVTDFI